ncbi:MAG: VTT domain-containing protein [Chloroflexi bacterium]|nr:VTT domain-containing protein [Chloroflexota bacterium]
MQVSQAIFSSTNWSGRRKLLIAGAVIFIGLILAFYDEVHVDPGAVLTFGYAAVFILPMIASLTLLLPLPVFPIIFLAGGLLDPVATGFLAAAGMTVGMAAMYFAAASGQDAVRSSIANRSGIAGRLAQKFLGGFERRPALATFIMSAIPGPQFSFSGLVAGAAGVPPRTYFLYTFLGRIVVMLPLALAGKFAAEKVQSLGWITM